jgi:hypothetical protein
MKRTLNLSILEVIGNEADLRTPMKAANDV